MYFQIIPDYGLCQFRQNKVLLIHNLIFLKYKLNIHQPIICCTIFRTFNTFSISSSLRDLLERLLIVGTISSLENRDILCNKIRGM